MVVVSHLFPFYRKILPNYSYFNPRLHEGGDPSAQFSILLLAISIHASEKEATMPRTLLRSALLSISIHASRKEATRLLLLLMILLDDFNPRLQEGGDFS